jgi:hypothetical protein
LSAIAVGANAPTNRIAARNGIANKASLFEIIDSKTRQLYL